MNEMVPLTPPRNLHPRDRQRKGRRADRMPATTGKRGREEELAPTPSVASPSFTHEPLSYFALEQLTPKGRRKNVDIGDPHDASRPLVKVGTASVGSWHCTEGGWDSAAPRPTTESFYVLTGEASVTDLDGTRHTFGPGDTVVLPKGWSGRWDVTKAIHKVWVVHEHEDVKGASVAASVTPPESFATAEMTQQARPSPPQARPKPARALRSPGWGAHRHALTGYHAATGCLPTSIAPPPPMHLPGCAEGRGARPAEQRHAQGLRRRSYGRGLLDVHAWRLPGGPRSMAKPRLPALFFAAAERAAYGPRRPRACARRPCGLQHNLGAAWAPQSSPGASLRHCSSS